MFNVDDKDLAVISLTVIAYLALEFGGVQGLDVVTNIVCALGGLVTGRALNGRA